MECSAFLAVQTLGIVHFWKGFGALRPLGPLRPFGPLVAAPPRYASAMDIDRRFEHPGANDILSHCTRILRASAPLRESVFLIVTHWK